MPPSALSRPHLRRLRQMFRSSGWPCHDPVEIDLLGAGLIERLVSPEPGLRPDTIRVTDAGVAALALAQTLNRRALGAHEALVRLTAQWLVAQVSRADLLGDLRQPGKRGAYFGLAQRVWYVLGESAQGEPIADPAEIPPDCGVLVACGDALNIARPIALPTWLALARAQPLDTEAASPQHCL